MGGDGATSASETSLEEAQRAFARYANYLLYGEERDTLDGEFEVGKTYELDRQLADKNPDSEYWNKASGLLNTAVTSYDRFPEKKESVVAWLKTEKMNFDFLNAYRLVEEPGWSTLLAVSDPFDADAARAYVAGLYRTEVNDQESSLASIYSMYKIQQYNADISIMEIYDRNGCINDTTISSECVAAITAQDDSETISAALTVSNAMPVEAAKVLQQWIDQIERDCWKINSLLFSIINEGGNSA